MNLDDDHLSVEAERELEWGVSVFDGVAVPLQVVGLWGPGPPW